MFVSNDGDKIYNIGIPLTVGFIRAIYKMTICEKTPVKKTGGISDAVSAGILEGIFLTVPQEQFLNVILAGIVAEIVEEICQGFFVEHFAEFTKKTLYRKEL